MKVSELGNIQIKVLDFMAFISDIRWNYASAILSMNVENPGLKVIFVNFNLISFGTSILFHHLAYEVYGCHIFWNIGSFCHTQFLQDVIFDNFFLIVNVLLCKGIIFCCEGPN